ncbi:MAG: DUF2344 domain-containing protein [Pirellulales bacterium]|nr:DUF2344 domain-containing protein [Pirellulales bacterium]
MVSTQRDGSSVRQRVRIRFAKQGDLRLIGHRDLVRAMERLFRRAGLRLGMSEGFHPKPRMSFPSALAVGIEGHDEVMELELAQPPREASLLADLSQHAVPGLAFHRVELLPNEGRIQKARLTHVTYRIAIPEGRRQETSRRAAELMAASAAFVDRPGRPEPLDLRCCLDALGVEDGELAIRLRVVPGANPGPRDVLERLGLADLESQGVCLRRTAVEVTP